MGLGHSPKIVTSNLAISLDFANIKNFNPSSNNISSSVSPRTVTWQIVNPQWVNFDYANGAVIFTRDPSASLNVAQKNVAGPSIKTTGNLFQTGANTITYTGFYYNDHTVEVWFQINNPAPSQYDATEVNSFLLAHRGFSNGLTYTSSLMSYTVWSGSTRANTMLSWSVGSSGLIKANQWYQLVAKREGNDWTGYLNGVAVTSKTGDNPPVNPSANFLGDLCIGSGWENGSNFQNYGVNTISNFKLYYKALSDEEILQNFNAYRTRFGL